MSTHNSFQSRCLDFSANVWKAIDLLPRTATNRHAIDQVTRSATSIGANAYEARSAESRADFLHKMQIALKEARETCYWLALLEKTSGEEAGGLKALVDECEQITAILAKSVITAKKNMGESDRGKDHV